MSYINMTKEEITKELNSLNAKVQKINKDYSIEYHYDEDIKFYLNKNGKQVAKFSNFHDIWNFCSDNNYPMKNTVIDGTDDDDFCENPNTITLDKFKEITSAFYQAISEYLKYNE